MRHTVKERKHVDSKTLYVTIELHPENQAEQNAIKKLENYTASDSERGLIENYIHFTSELGGQVLEAQQEGRTFILKLFTGTI